MRAAGRSSLSLQGSRSTYTNGSLRGNPVLGGMYRARRTSQQSNLAKVPELLIQPLLPALSQSRRSINSIRKQSCDLSYLRAQSTSGDRYQSKTTNVNFAGFQHHRPSPSSGNGRKATQRRGLSRLSTKHRISLHRQSKLSHLLNFVQNILEENPRVRPNICSVITGLFVTVLGLVFFAVPLFQVCIPSWLSVVLVCTGAVVMIAGIIGSLAYVYKNTDYTKKISETKMSSKEGIKHKTIPSKDGLVFDREKTKIGNLLTNSGQEKLLNRQQVADCSLPTCKSQKVCCHGHTRANGILLNASGYLQAQSLFPKTVSPDCSDCPKHKDAKLVNKHNFFIDHDAKAFPVRSSVPPIFLDLKRNGYYSSEPNLLGDKNFPINWQKTDDQNVEARNEVAKNEDGTVEGLHSREQSAVDSETPRQVFSDTPAVNGSPKAIDQPVQFLPTVHEKTMHSAQILAAKELFDVYHDPLLHSAITHLTYRCHFEFCPNGGYS